MRAFAAILLLSGSFLAGCKKNTGPKKPFAVSAPVELVEYVLNTANDAPDYVYIHFRYNDYKFVLSAISLDPASKNGTLLVADTNVIAANSALSLIVNQPNKIQVTSPSPNTYTATIDRFVILNGTGTAGYPGDVTDFNKLTLTTTATTKIIVIGHVNFPGDETFANTYVKDLPGFTSFMRRIASYNNNSPGTAGTQNTPFVLAVSN